MALDASSQSSNKSDMPAASQLPSDKPAENGSADPRGKKRKWEKKGQRQQHGSKRHKGRDMGRQEYFRANIDKRERNARSQEKRASDNPNAKANPFTAEEIEGDTRQPKRKVAVMMGYAGSGYKGMQMVPDQKTIEGDLFTAFIKAGAISKANADDPKKSTFVRCARTDKGVHAAGNVVSLKLIIEDPKVVEKINEHLPPQIRIWGIERTTASFSCYQACDSRWYEYLIPTHCFLPPHPSSFLGTKLVELAEEAGELDEYKKRQEEVEGFWEKVEAEQIKPLLEALDPTIREQVEQALYHASSDEKALEEEEEEDEEEAEKLIGMGEVKASNAAPTEAPLDGEGTVNTEKGLEEAQAVPSELDQAELPGIVLSTDELLSSAPSEHTIALRAAIKSLKDVYVDAKRQWRIPPARLARVQEAFAVYKGTLNFHNYTIRKSARDPSAKRHILSFKVNPTPIIIGDTEWLSLKVHGQSFMMHQIRKMVGMASLVVRCGSNIERTMRDSFSEELYAIPKAPALGLLLERPVFDSYNTKAAREFSREEIGFEKYEKEMEDFKRREIYERIFGEEEKENVFHAFFAHVDNFRTPTFLYLSSKGLEACGGPRDVTTRHEMSRQERKKFLKGRDRNAEQLPSKEEGNDMGEVAAESASTEKAAEPAEKVVG